MIDQKIVLDARETARTLDTNGWIEISGNPLSKVGVFDYSGESLGGAAKGFDPGKIYKVYRSAEALSDPETIESFKLLPWIDDHPSRLLGSPESDRIPAEQKGISGVIGEDVYFDGKYLRGNIKIFSDEMAKKIKSGKIELSPGYLAKYTLSNGVFEGQEYEVVQTHLRGNHLALVDVGRTGPDVRVLDQQEKTVEEEKKEVAETAQKDEESVAGGLTLEGLRDQLAALSQIVNNFITSAGDKKSMDEDKEKKDDEKKENGSMDAAEIRKSMFVEISRRDQLAKSLLSDIGAFDHAEMSLDEVAKYAVKKLGLKCSSGHELAALDGYILANKKVSEKKSETFDHKKSISGDQVSNYLSDLHKGGK